MERDATASSGVASASAFGAGLAWVAWAMLNARTHGGLDAGPSSVGESTARIGALLQVSWNLLLLPAALVLHARLEPAAPAWMRLVTLSGIASLLFWAFGSATRTITPVLEVSYLLLSAVWWGGLGILLRAERRWFGVFTLLLAAFAAWDAVLTALEPVPWGLYLTAAPKLPLSIVWDFALAWVLVPNRRVRETALAKLG
jgi:hypothetical protein